jgi:hypothetical protein
MKEVDVQENEVDARSSSNSTGWKKGCIAGAILLTLASGVYLSYYAFAFHPKPSEIAAPLLFMIGLASLALLVIPWKELGFFPTEIAGVKFERIANEQKKEQIDAIVPIQQDIDKLKAQYEAILGSASLNMVICGEQLAKKEQRLVEQAGDQSNKTLENTVLAFLRQYRGQFFSPLRIQQWGGARAGFEVLSDHSTDQIRKALFEGVRAGMIDTSISKKGNTLYGVSAKRDWEQRNDS